MLSKNIQKQIDGIGAVFGKWFIRHLQQGFFNAQFPTLIPFHLLQPHIG